MSNSNRAQFERANPILRVADMAVAVRYYVEVLGFTAAPWGDEWFTCVSRDAADIYLSAGEQGAPGSWVWVGVSDAEALHAEISARGARIRRALRNYPWAMEMVVEDLDGNVLRMGSEPREDQPYDEWQA